MTTEASAAQREALKYARVFLGRFPAPDLAQIEKCCQRAKAEAEEFHGSGTVDLQELVNYFRRTTNIYVEPLQSLSDPTGHIEWLPGRRGQIVWNFWDRYSAFLEDVEELPGPVLKSVDRRTESILEKLEDPTRPGTWDRRGLVVGSVQSGKTGNFLGLACKALDAGYRLIIILAGTHNSLRTQTQIRMEEGVLGFNTASSLSYSDATERVGVGTLRFPDLLVNSMTSRADDGDFKTNRLNTSIQLGSDPYIVVVKKHTRILENLRKWLVSRTEKKDEKGNKVVMGVPMLLIDDEADHSSIDVKRRALPEGATAQDVDPSQINKRIRELLSAFEKRAYVGYTATPFANIFIDPNSVNERLGDDIFPRSFIVSLPPPDNYVSVEKVFGRDGDADTGLDATPGLPLRRPVTDFESVFPPRYGKDFKPDCIPDSMRAAIRSFVLACAARHARGQRTKHNSMLIHVVRFIEVQGHLRDLVEVELLQIQRRIQHEGTRAVKSIRQELRELWESDFMVTTKAIGDPNCPLLTWTEIEAVLLDSASKIRVLEINGASSDILDYELNRETGVSVIVIGGDKLSRGLTLEGLTVSYYMRMSKMYDSLLQMGRWFGYRDGYLDVCRIYTSSELVDWYRHIALAEAELRREFDRMAMLKATPIEYGLRVRTHPGGMLVTALNKSRASAKMLVTFEGTLSQCVLLDTRDQPRKRNDSAVGSLLKRQGTPTEFKRNRVWHSVSADDVCQFLDEFSAPMGSNGFDPQRLREFIAKQVRQGQLTSWTVALMSVAGGRSDVVGGRFDVQLITRAREPKSTSTSQSHLYALRNSNVLSPSDQAIDFLAGDDITVDVSWAEQLLEKKVFSPGENSIAERRLIEEHIGHSAYDLAREITKHRFSVALKEGRTRPNQTEPTTPSGAAIRDVRPAERGLLLIYPLDCVLADLPADPPIVTCALSFPSSSTALPVEYQVNEIYRKLHLDDIEDVDDAD